MVLLCIADVDYCETVNFPIKGGASRALTLNPDL